MNDNAKKVSDLLHEALFRLTRSGGLGAEPPKRQIRR
jgi:hypothetical protein